MQTNRAVCVFYALTGQFDSPGSNVLFASTPTNPVRGLDLLPHQQAARRLGYTERPLGPPGAGLVRAQDVYRAILDGQPYPVKAMVAFGSDPLIAVADPLLGRKALAALDFYVHVDLFANPSACLADILLPAASSWESQAVWPGPPPFALSEATANWAQYRRPVVQPVFEARPDLDIVFDLAHRLGLGNHFFEGDVEAAFNYQLAPSGLTVEQLRDHPIGARAPVETRYRKYREIDVRTGRPRGFETPTGKIEIFATSFAKAGYPPLPAVRQAAETTDDVYADGDKYPLALTFSRLVQFVDEEHRNIPRLRRQVREPFLEINPLTAGALSIENDEWIIVETNKGAVTLKAKLTTSVEPRVVVTQYGWWQACQDLGASAYAPFVEEGANVNLLIDGQICDPISGAVAHRSQRCRVRKRTASSPGAG
jgi:anaerobic selenocysteine-containing dehydrogenase